VSNPYKSLGSQSLIYGLGNIVPRFLNYAVLTVYYTRRFTPGTYGVITELYAYVAILMVILTYGMETGLFKFSINNNNRGVAYSSILISVITTSVFFIVLMIFFKSPIAHLIGYKNNPEYIVFLALILAIDAVSAIIFAKLRIENRARRFAIIKIVNVLSTIFFVFLFLEIFPHVFSNSLLYKEHFKNIEVGYVFIANLLSSILVLLMLIGDLSGIKFILDINLLKKILGYSVPLLVAGLAGIFNETVDRILLKNLTPDKENALYELGIYGANYRIAVLMTIFVQMFRYAAEPFFFNYYGKEDSKKIYSNVLKYFTIFLMILFLGVGLCLDLFKLFIHSSYHEGLGIVPVVLFANVLVGLLFNVNMWYKLSGNTIYGVYITGLGAVITIILNIIFIPVYGYYACAWIHVLANGVMLIITYYTGQKHFKIQYDVKSIGIYLLLGIVLYIIGRLIETNVGWLNVLTGLVIVCIYVLYVNKKDHLINIFLSRHES
jgi:O-antigen/teichoic acid export membrane protein